MKPNDKAIEAGVKICWDCPRATPSMIRDILTAAYAAQFPPSEDYAGLVKWLRDKAESLSEIYPPEAEAADALEAVLAERDALKKALETEQSTCIKVGNERAAALLERDALLARLAPVEDEALETIAARTIVKENVYKETQIPSKTLARAAIAAIRPHIEAAERERCAKIADEYVNCLPDVIPQIAAAIRSGK